MVILNIIVVDLKHCIWCEQGVTEIIPNYRYGAARQHSLWDISLVDLKRGVFERDAPRL